MSNNLLHLMVRGASNRSILGALSAFAGAIMMTACSGPGGPAPGNSGGTPPSPNQPTECSASIEEPCMRYRIPLFGNPNMDLPLRNKYIAAFGNACYMSYVNTFDCFYQKWQTACADAVKMAEVSGAAPFDKGYTCQPVAGTDDYTLQVGPDVANEITINYQAAPRQMPLVEIDGVPTEVNGPYRNLVEVTAVEPGKDFYDNSGVADEKGGYYRQRDWILQVNRKKNNGKIRSDLAGFTWPCKGADGGVTTCKELDELVDPDPDKQTPPVYPGAVAQVHHVVPVKDKRCCPWGTNAYKNAAVISAQLNEYFTNNNPPPEQVKMLNNAQAYTP